MLESIDNPVDTSVFTKRQVLHSRPALAGKDVGDEKAGNLILVHSRLDRLVHVKTIIGMTRIALGRAAIQMTS